MPPTKHSKLSASNAHRWMNCAGSVRMSEGIEDVETIYQLEGRAAHALAEEALKTLHWRQLSHVDVDTKDGTQKFSVTDEMREAVALYAETVTGILRQRNGGTLYVERTFDLGPLNPPVPMFGTADAVIVGPRWIEVIDLKYGAGVVVDVQENEQLLYYALGAIIAEFVRQVYDVNSVLALDEDETILEAATRAFDEIRITIVQPRAPHTDGPVRSSLTFTGEEIARFGWNLLEKAHDTMRAGSLDPMLKAGSWCQFCPARGHCPELAAHAKLVAQTDFENVPMEALPDVERLSIERVADMLKSVDILNIFVAALRERVTRELEAGREVPGWKMVNKRAMRRWIDPTEVEKWATYSGGIDIYETKLRSPAQVEAIIGKKNLPDGLYARVSSGLTLVADSDPRPAAAVGPSEDFAALPPGEPGAE